jgi:hypothetical protein
MLAAAIATVIMVSGVVIYVGYMCLAFTQETIALLGLGSVEIIGIAVGLYPFLWKEKLNAQGSLI